jgi:hypothetical protein
LLGMTPSLTDELQKSYASRVWGGHAPCGPGTSPQVTGQRFGAQENHHPQVLTRA